MIINGTLSRYFGMRFLTSVVGSFVGVVALAAMIDYVELMRRGADWPNATAWLLAKISMYRVPQLTERIMPFSVLVGAMSCYLSLSRRLELVVARAAGVSAWQFVAPAMIGAFVFGTVATTVYNPVSAVLHERSKRLEADMLGENLSALAGEHQRFLGPPEERRRRGHHQCQFEPGARRRRSAASASSPSTATGHFQARIEAKSATLQQGYWQLDDARIYDSGKAPDIEDSYRLATNLTLEQVRESFATPETVPFWQLPNLHRDGGPRRPRRGRLPAAISTAPGAPVPARRHGHARGLRELALLPIRRRAEDGFERHLRRLSFVRSVENHGGHEQVRTHVADRRRHGFLLSLGASLDSSRCCTRRTGSGAFA